jgi:hypothetical protein
MLAETRRHAKSTPTRRPRRRYGPDAEGLETRNLLSSMTYQYHQLHPVAAIGPRLGAFGAADLDGPSPLGYGPSDIRRAYGFDRISFTDVQGHAIPGDGRGQTIAIVDAFDAPNIVADLHTFDQQFGLPDPPRLVKVNQTGGTTYPRPDDGWGKEIALDVEWAHAMAPQANILLVEANTSEDGDMWPAVDYARRQPGVVAVSMSWGRDEHAGQSQVDAHLVTPSGHGGVTFLAASGDDGEQPVSPSTSPNAVSVGGTSLVTGYRYGLDYATEIAWWGSAGGISSYNPQPAYQHGVVSPWSTTMRTGPDVAFNADRWNGFNIYYSRDGSGWDVVGGTSAGAPQWAALVAIADQGRALKGLGSLDGPTQVLPALYRMPDIDFNDTTMGGNFNYDCETGYDLVTGLGSPHADLVVSDLVRVGTATGPFTVFDEPVSVTEGQAFSGAVAWVRDTYAGDTTSSITARIDWGDGVASIGTVVGNGRGGFDITGTHTYAEAGRYTIRVAATRKGGGSASANGQATVADAPLEAYGFYSLFAWTGQATDQAVAWFLDGNHIAEASDFTATIRWGDGTTSPGRLVSQGYGMFDVVGTHTYAHAGHYTIQVTIKDVGGNTASATSPMSVDDGGLLASLGNPVSATRNPSFTAAVDTSLDGDPIATPADLTAPIAWGDGPASTSKIRAKGYGGFNVVGQHTYARAGNYTIHVGLKDIYGTSLAVDATAYVSAAAQVTTATGGRGLTGAVASPTTSDPFAIDSLGPPDPIRVLDEALGSFGGASRPRPRWATR